MDSLILRTQRIRDAFIDAFNAAMDRRFAAVRVNDWSAYRQAEADIALYSAHLSEMQRELTRLNDLSRQTDGTQG